MKKLSLVGIVIALIFGLVTVGLANESVEALKKHDGDISKVIDLLDKGNKEPALKILDSLHSTVTAIRTSLRGFSFCGEEAALSDPFTLPVGTYRVHLTMKGFGVVKVLDMKGEMLGYLFRVHEGWMNEEIQDHKRSTVYKSEGGKIMVEVGRIETVSPPQPPPESFKIRFEKLN